MPRSFTRPELEARARVHAALGDPGRLAIVDELSCSDRSPSELTHRLGMAGNLLAHHLDTLQAAGLVERSISAGDRRRRYVRLLPVPAGLAVGHGSRRVGPMLFVCTHNSARSQLAAALWRDRIGGPASSAGTHPSSVVHPGAVAAATRSGFDLDGAAPRLLCADDTTAPEVQVVTVCDRVHEELVPDEAWWHWSIADPVGAHDAAAFDDAVAEIDTRISSLGLPRTATALSPNRREPPDTVAPSTDRKDAP